MSGKLYRHFKGGLYEFVGTVQYREEDELLVLYRSVNNEDWPLFAQTYEWFFSSAISNGLLVPRFVEET